MLYSTPLTKISFTKNTENFFKYSYKDYAQKSNKSVQEFFKYLKNPPDNSKPIGTAFCEILNNYNKIRKILWTFYTECNNECMSGKNDNEIICIIFKKLNQLSDTLKKTSPYLTIIDIAISNYWSQILNIKQILTTVPNINLEEVKKEILNEYSNYKKEVELLIERFTFETIMWISNFSDLINNNISKKNHMFYLPEKTTTIHLSNCSIKYITKKETKDIDIQHKKLETKKNVEEYSYQINNLNELLNVSFYQILHNGFHIRKCVVCKKLFVDKTNSYACSNPSVINPKKTCRELSKQEYNEDLGVLEYSHRKISQYFRDNKNNKKISNSKKDVIERNFELYKETVKNMKKNIKNFSNSEEYVKYLGYYAEYLKKVEILIYEEKNFNIKDLSNQYLKKFKNQQS